MNLRKFFVGSGLALLFWLGPSFGQELITSPKAQFGFEIGADYVLASYTQLMAYWQTLDRESDRLSLEKIGTTAEGRSLLPMTVLVGRSLIRWESGLTASSTGLMDRLKKSAAWLKPPPARSS